MIYPKLNEGTYTGYWFLDTDSQDRIDGSVMFKSDGSMIFKTFEEVGGFDSTTIFNKENKLSLIYGVATNDSDQTYIFYLYNLVPIKFSSGFFNKLTFKVNDVLIGEFENNFELKDSFTDLYLSSETLRTKIKRTGFTTNNFSNKKQYLESVQYKQPETSLLFENNDYKIEFFFRARSYWKRNEIIISELPFLNTEFSKPKNLKEIYQYRRLVERFIMVLFEAPHTFSKSQVQVSDGPSLQIYENRRIIDPVSNVKITEKELIRLFDLYFAKWLKVTNELQLTLNSFFFAIADYSLNPNSKFLNFISSLEFFHKKKFGIEVELMSEKNKPMYQKALQQIESSEVKNWLEGVFRKKKNISLNKRLTHLNEYVGSSPLLSQQEIKRIESTRHFLVHLDKEHENSALLDEELRKINLKLMSLMFKLLKKVVSSE